MKTLKHFFFISLFLIIYFQQIYSQNADTSNSEQKIEVIKLTEIPIEIEKATSLVLLEKQKLKDSEDVIEVKKLFEKVDSNFNINKSKLDSIDLSQQTSGKIKELLRHWKVVQSDVSQLLGDITDQTTELESQKGKFQQLLNVWKITKSDALKKNIPKDLITEITKLQSNLNNIIKLLTDELNLLLVIQTDLSKYSIEVDNIIAKIKKIEDANRRNILTRNAPPLWNIGSDTTETKSLSDEFSDILISYKTSYSEFLVTYEKTIPGYIIVFLIFFLFVLYLKTNSKKIESDETQVEQTLIILNYPLSATLLIFGIMMTFFYGDAPAAFKSMVKIILLIPLVRIMVKIINPAMIKPLLIFAVLFVINQIKVVASSATSIERILLFALTIISILGTIWIVKGNQLSDELCKEEQNKYVFLARKAALILFTFSLLANIFGFVKLGIVLVNGIYDTFFATAILVTGNIIMHVIFLVFLKTKFALKFRVVRFQANIIKKTSEKIIGILVKIIWLVVVLNAFNIYVPVRDWIEAFLSAEIGFGSFATSLSDILLFIGTIWVSYQITKLLRFVLEGDILPRLDLPRGVPGTISTLTKYFILTLGVIIAVSSVGLNLDKFAILIGALGVGIGFGLQDLVNNFISGLILIFERPIQVGDFVHFNTIEGRVTNIGIRASRIKTWQGSEIIVPNGHLVSNDVVNWTFSDKMRRIEIKVGVEYGCDVNQIKELLLSCAKSDDRVLSNPEPAVIFRDFGDSSLDFELRCWTKDFELWFAISSELRFAINKVFAENEITIPFPQRDIYIKSPNAQDLIEEGDEEKNQKGE